MWSLSQELQSATINVLDQKCLFPFILTFFKLITQETQNDQLIFTQNAQEKSKNPTNKGIVWLEKKTKNCIWAPIWIDPIRGERWRCEARRWENPKMYAPKLYQGLTIPCRHIYRRPAQRLVTIKRFALTVSRAHNLMIRCRNLPACQFASWSIFSDLQKWYYEPHIAFKQYSFLLDNSNFPG